MLKPVICNKNLHVNFKCRKFHTLLEIYVILLLKLFFHRLKLHIFLQLKFTES